MDPSPFAWTLKTKSETENCKFQYLKSFSLPLNTLLKLPPMNEKLTANAETPANSALPSPSLREVQQKVDEWIRTIGVRYFDELTNLACLTEEVGELARVMARTYGQQSFKAGESANLADEMADVLWVLVCLANQTGVDLTEAFQKNMEKKTKRDKMRHQQNEKLR